MTKALDIGCGLKPKNPFNAVEVYGIDVRNDTEAGIFKADLVVEPIPFPENAFDFVTAHDFLEHIPRLIYCPERRNAFVEVMNEVWRVLKPGGVFMSFTPAYPHPEAFRDPTHVNIITDQTFPAYFDTVNRWASGYGFKGAFQIVSQEWRGPHLMSILRKVEVAEQPITCAVDGSETIPIPVPRMNNSDQLHINHWENFFDDELHARLYPTWWDDSTANHWRHRRFMEPVLDVLQTKDNTWLTIGDGSGHDTWIMRNEGFKDVLTTDIGDGTLKRSLAEGHIQKFEQANAENLQFAANQFDFVLCKEAFHHMRRPYLGIYEMLRVARQAVVLIEPQDQWGDFPPRAGDPTPFYERVGNYVYTLSKRDVQKLSLGLNLPGYACKNMQDVYIQGCEFAKATPTDPVFSTMVNAVNVLEQKCQLNQEKWNYILTILFKDESLFTNQEIVNRMQAGKWHFEKTCTNPHLVAAH